MDLKISFYGANKILKRGFQTASGVLLEKEIIQIIISKGCEDLFIYELPLSPSLGEMPELIWEELDQHHNKLNFDRLKSKYVKIALSYLINLGVKKQFFPKINTHIDEITVQTLSIGEPPEDNTGEAIIKYKGSIESLDQIITNTLESKHKWIADFNRSLDKDAWTYFCKKTDFSNCYFIEQPLAVGALTQELADLTPARIFADEEMLYLNPHSFIKSPFEGFVLKSIRHSYEELTQWMHFGNTQKIPFLIGSMTSDIIDRHFYWMLNESATIRQKPKNYVQFSSFEGELFGDSAFKMKGSSIEVNPDVFSYIKRNYTLKKTLFLFS